MTSQSLAHPAINGVLSTAATLLGMEVVFIGGLTEDTFTFERVAGTFPGIAEGVTLERSDTLCHRMLAGAPRSTSQAALEPLYRDSPALGQYGVTSYVGVPIRRADGTIVGTLCGLDRGSKPVEETTVGVLEELAQIVGTLLGPLATEGVMIRRTPAGWEVAGQESGDLTSAMVLADLLAAELQPGVRPARPEGMLDEIGQLRLSVTQLEHALAARVVVEQAIGVLAERQHRAPRDAFERLRRVARSRGRKVHDLAREVVASANDGSIPLPPELGGPR
ncbi:MAG: GAF and ANTAR domain-containing protein [Actinomycetota bacterium]|nr:GAF and ANTAR domain-containing protein [Actinomycetota bacterium]